MDQRPCERQCAECKLWKHHSRFRTWKRRHSTVSTAFSLRCRDCEQRLRNIVKNEDRPRALILQRAAQAATKAGCSREFFWVQMNYRNLVPILRAAMTKESQCLGCGHAFLNERDIQIEHIEPPRSLTDFARLHARNLRLLCGSCNRTKGPKSFTIWLDEQEQARASHLAEPVPLPPVQGQLFPPDGH
jgi:hypothetical protein